MRKIMKKVILLFLTVGMSIIGISSVAASEYPSSLTATRYEMESTPVKFPNTFYVKKSNDGQYIYCLSYLKKVPVSSVNYKHSELITDPGTNYILQKAYGASSDKEHFIYQSALWIYLMDKGYMESSNVINTFKKTLNSEKNSNASASKILEIINTAKAQKSYNTKAPTIDFSASDVTFKLSGDYYVSSKIILNDSQSNTDYSKKLKVSSNINDVTYEINRKSGDDSSDGVYTYEIVVKVPASEVTKTQKITLNVSNSKTYYESHKYLPVDNSAYQELAKVIKVSKTASDSISLSVSPVYGKAIISKQDITTKEELAGATLVVKDSNDKVIDEWVSTTKAHELTLKPGTYTLEETIAPEGYVLSTERINFTIKNDGSTTQVVMKNSPKVVTKVSISKQDATTGEELEGAHLIVRDDNNNIVDEWISGTTSHIITGLEPGTYTLEETIAPTGYILSTEKVTFTVKEDGSTTEVVMKNELAPEIEVPATGTYKSVVSSLIGGLIVISGSVLITKNMKKKNEE